MSGEHFEYCIDLPDKDLNESARFLVGFNERYARLKRDIELLAMSDDLVNWGKKFYGSELRICAVVAERYPLIVFSGDVGTGKTVTAKAMCSLIAQETGRRGHLFALGTRVRGAGKVGQASTQIDAAFKDVALELGTQKLCFMLIDEADSLASDREFPQSHLEDKIAVNTIIQKIDDLRRHKGRFLLILSTNRIRALDPAILRRAARIEVFERPSDVERRQVLELDCQGLGLSPEAIERVIALTGCTNGRPSFTYSDLRTRLLPAALSYAFPDRRITDDDMVRAAESVEPSPSITQ